MRAKVPSASVFSTSLLDQGYPKGVFDMSGKPDYHSPEAIFTPSGRTVDLPPHTHRTYTENYLQMFSKASK